MHVIAKNNKYFERLNWKLIVTIKQIYFYRYCTQKKHSLRLKKEGIKNVNQQSLVIMESYINEILVHRVFLLILEKLTSKKLWDYYKNTVSNHAKNNLICGLYANI